MLKPHKFIHSLFSLSLSTYIHDTYNNNINNIYAHNKLNLIEFFCLHSPLSRFIRSFHQIFNSITKTFLFNRRLDSVNR
ncbi:hypothetical protein QVD17_37501 [Tagetes erecta]|uniref:Uncharacterized protein n=1 Tax=Tagetes erecta TaxID=13708 RepID=A0AAD8NK34_TARER|nr:hypothetical protein QVD17_37501 [Tagetes erecta]